MTTTLKASTAPAWPRWQRGAFTAAALAALGLIGLLLLRPSLFSGILNPNTIAGAAAHFKNPEHRVHDISFGLLYGSGALGLLTQLRRPRNNVAGQFVAVIPWVALATVMVLTEYWLPFGTRFQMYATAVFGGFSLAAGLLHPAGRTLFSRPSSTGASKPMVALTAVGAVPLLVYAATNIGLQRDIARSDIHWQLGHYGFVAALALTAVGVAVVASLRPVGWRIAAWLAGFLPAALGVLSLAYPDVLSSIAPTWAVAAILWGATFIAVAEREVLRRE